MISTIHTNAGITLAQAQPNATGARISDGNGHSIDVTYDQDIGAWVIDTAGAAVGVAIDQPGNTILLRKL